MGQRPTYEDENGFYLATSLAGSAALPFVISTGAERSLCGCLFLEMFFDGAKPNNHLPWDRYPLLCYPE
jgi:hypothetical protein